MYRKDLLLDPVLFIIYLDELLSICNSNEGILYADDTTFVINDRCVEFAKKKKKSLSYIY